MIDGQWLSVMLPVTVIMSMIMTKEGEEQDLFDEIIINVHTIIWKCRRAVSCGSCGHLLLSTSRLYFNPFGLSVFGCYMAGAT